MEIRVENIVAYAQIAESLELPDIAKELSEGEYQPEKFPALIIKEKNSRSILLFRSGKAVCTGLKEPDDLPQIFKTLGKRLKKVGVKVAKEPEINIQNIVATSKIDSDINLNAIALSFGLERVDFEPEKFPGLVFHMDDPQLVTILYESGKVVCSGGKSVSAIQDGMDQLESELRSAELI